MGVWGFGPFENDDAGDLLAAVSENGLRPVRRAIATANRQKPGAYVQIDRSCRVVAAAAVVAALRGHAIAKLPEDLQEVSARLAAKVTGEDCANARSALEKVTGKVNNELHDELKGLPAEDRKAWSKTCTSLRAALRAAKTAPVKQAPPPKKKRFVLREGDLVAIPLNKRSFALTRCLFVSVELKYVCLLGIYAQRLKPSEIQTPSAIRPKGRFIEQIYTDRRFVVDGDWPIVGHVPLADKEQQYSLRVDCLSVYLKDQKLRSARDEDYANLRFLVFEPGDTAIETLREVFAARGI